MKRPLPPVWFLLAILLMTALHYLFPVTRWLTGGWRWAGAVPIGAGLGVILGCNSLFRRHDTTIKPFEISTALVTGGPYARSRNPIYLGLIAILGGIWVAQGTLSPVLVIPLFGPGGLWIAWPKKASGIASDLTQTAVRRSGLARGLVDYKICAIDATWSGLRFARRKKR